MTRFTPPKVWKCDPKLQESTERCEIQNSMLPKTKEIVRWKILARRPELSVSENDVTSDNVITKEAEIRMKERRERNRLAAARCRNRKKIQENNLTKNILEEEEKNTLLKKTLKTLKNEKWNLYQQLSLHRKTCPVLSTTKQMAANQNMNLYRQNSNNGLFDTIVGAKPIPTADNLAFSLQVSSNEENSTQLSVSEDKSQSAIDKPVSSKTSIFDAISNKQEFVNVKAFPLMSPSSSTKDIFESSSFTHPYSTDHEPPSTFLSTSPPPFSSPSDSFNSPTHSTESITSFSPAKNICSDYPSFLSSPLSIYDYADTHSFPFLPPSPSSADIPTTSFSSCSPEKTFYLPLPPPITSPSSSFSPSSLKETLSFLQSVPHSAVEHHSPFPSPPPSISDCSTIEHHSSLSNTPPVLNSSASFVPYSSKETLSPPTSVPLPSSLLMVSLSPSATPLPSSSKLDLDLYPLSSQAPSLSYSLPFSTSSPLPSPSSSSSSSSQPGSCTFVLYSKFPNNENETSNSETNDTTELTPNIDWYCSTCDFSLLNNSVKIEPHTAVPATQSQNASLLAMTQTVPCHLRSSVSDNILFSEYLNQNLNEQYDPNDIDLEMYL